MTCIRGQGASCDCDDELVAIFRKLTVADLRKLDSAGCDVVLDSITEAVEQMERKRIPAYVLAGPPSKT